MILHQHKLVPPLGSKDHPILIDPDTQDASNRYPASKSSLSPTFAPNTSVSPGFFPRYGLDKSTTPMSGMDFTTSTQDVMEPGDLKRKRDAVDDFEEAQLGSAQRVRKAEKKRRKRERRAARVARLVEKMPSSSNHMRSNSLMWGAPQHLPPIHLNFTILPGKLTWDSHASGGPNFPLPSHPLSYLTQVPDPDTFEMDVENIGHNERSPEFLPPPPYTEVGPSTPQGTIPYGQPLSPIPPVTGESATLPDAPEHQLNSLDYGHHPLISDNGTPVPSLNEIIVNKQNLLDRAISENKEALIQLDGPTTPEQKASLTKSFFERNKFIAQLTREIKGHFVTLQSSPVHEAAIASKFRWPRTEFPLYVDLTSDEESDSDA